MKKRPTITLAAAPNEMGRWPWLVVGAGWCVASSAETFEAAACQARAEAQKQEKQQERSKP